MTNDLQRLFQEAADLSAPARCQYFQDHKSIARPKARLNLYCASTRAAQMSLRKWWVANAPQQICDLRFRPGGSSKEMISIVAIPHLAGLAKERHHRS